MKRTTADGNSGNLYQDRNTTLGRVGTLIQAEDKNLIQEEICNAIEGAGITLNGSDDTQLLQAIKTLQLRGAVHNWFGVAHSTDPDDYQGNDILSIAADGAGVVIGASNSTHVFKSNSYGAGWQTVTSGLGSATNLHNALYANSNFYLISSGGAVWKSTDSGDSWSLNATFNNALLGGGFSVTLSTRPGGGMAYGNGRLLAVGSRSDNTNAVAVYSDDDGATWDYFDISSDIAATSIDVLSIVYTGTSFLLTFTGDSNTVWRSTDGGENWTASTDLTGVVTSNPYHKVAAGGGVVLFSGGGKVFKSTDDGINFASTPVLDKSSTFGRFSDVVYGNGIWVVIGGGYFSPYTGSPEQIFISTDSGATWEGAAVPEINTIYQAIYAGGCFIACCNTGTNRIFRTLKAF
jgi:photosystem II stability/assembly factor-like uncharacterized protein